ncbi:hypothetical protein [Actinomadura sp. DC4]|uniref:hypothetical protein n=1 Tax=Actinomadura sp. DC4 TaxID=3055069 RepID=UPI0025B17844|nr:hypothetical protein [Actinomadura sp. DC4]MDN3356454.1 hypothetical protein [Actinomadura sp. DC4]
MKCPACENDVPSGRSACAQCGTPLPSAGERPGPESPFAAGSPMGPQAGPQNPKTEPLPIPVWDEDDEHPSGTTGERPWQASPQQPPAAAPSWDGDAEQSPGGRPGADQPWATAGEQHWSTSAERSWDVPPDRYTAPEADAAPSDPGPAPQNFGTPPPRPRPLEGEAAAPDQAEPPSHERPWSRWDLDAPDPVDFAAQSPDSSWPKPPENDPPAWGSGTTGTGSPAQSSTWSSPPESDPPAWGSSTAGADSSSRAPWPSPPEKPPSIWEPNTTGGDSSAQAPTWSSPPPSDTPDPANQQLGAPWPDVPPVQEPGGWSAAGSAADNSTRHLGNPWSRPPAGDPPAWGSSPPAGDPATQNLGTSWPDPPPAQDIGEWDRDLSPLPGASDRTEKNRKVPLLIVGIAAVVVLGGGGLVYALTQGSDSTAQTPGGKPAAGGAAQQAAAVNRILKSGRTARGHLPGRLRTCNDVSTGVSGFQQVVKDRQQELSQSKQLTVDQLKNGTRLRRSMISAYQNSLNADQAYLAWAQEVQARNCGGRIAPLTAHYRNAITANGKAGPAKRLVVGLWRPIANTHGLPTYAWNRL